MTPFILEPVDTITATVKWIRHRSCELAYYAMAPLMETRDPSIALESKNLKSTLEKSIVHLFIIGEVIT